MKLIIAYIQPHKLNDVKSALVRAKIFKMSITNSIGCGQQGGYDSTWKGVHTEVSLIKKVRMEIAVNEAFVDKAIDTIMESALTNSIGDGKIFVLPIERVYRIRNGETNENAVG